MPREPVSIKGTKHGLLIICEPSSDFEKVKQILTEKLNSANGFFKGAKFILDQPNKSPGISEKQISELKDICQEYGLLAHNSMENIYNLPVEQIVNSAQLAKHSGTPPINSPGEPTLFVQKNLRSGQKISYPGHVVILGNINRGAEIIASGNIIVLGNCKGVVHAGYPENLKAKVIATFLVPSHLSIAQFSYKISAQHLPNNPEIAFIRNQKIVVLDYISKHLQAQ